MATTYDKASLVLIPSGTKEGVLFSQKPTNGDGDFTFSRSTAATRVNADGLIELVTDNVPRLDYTDSSCPSLLLEPQRTNLVTYSEEFDNAAWGKTSATVTANSATSPSGTTTADLFVPASGSAGRVEQNTSAAAVNNTVYTGSIYFKKPTLAIDNITFYISSGGALGANRFGITVNLTNFTGAVFNFGNGVTTSVSVVSVGNDWYRAIFTGSVTSGAAGNWSFVARVLTTNATIDGTNGLFIWGAQLEVGSYATSYIPTYGSAVTKLEDECSVTGVSDLIGQTEGTLFLDFNPLEFDSTSRYLSIESASGVSGGWIGIFGNSPSTIRIYGDGFDVSFGGYSVGDRAKIALTYKNGVATNIYINGVNKGSITANTTSKNYSILKVGNAIIGGIGVGEYKEVLVFPTALTDEELAALTTI